MSMLVLDEAEVRALIHGKIDSREWWILPWLDGRSAALSQRIEETFYAGDASPDFELVAGGSVPGVLALAFAQKRRMTARQLARLLIRNSANHLGSDVAHLTRQLHEHDVVISCEDRQTAEMRMAVFQAWLEGRVSA